jgi:hypothetical protein
MKKSRKRSEENSLQSPNFVAVLAIVGEMAKQLKENISKVEIKPLDSSLAIAVSPAPVESSRG